MPSFWIALLIALFISLPIFIWASNGTPITFDRLVSSVRTSKLKDYPNDTKRDIMVRSSLSLILGLGMLYFCYSLPEPAIHFFGTIWTGYAISALLIALSVCTYLFRNKKSFFNNR